MVYITSRMNRPSFRVDILYSVAGIDRKITRVEALDIFVYFAFIQEFLDVINLYNHPKKKKTKTKKTA